MYMAFFFSFAVKDLKQQRIDMLEYVTQMQQDTIHNWVEDKMVDLNTLAKLDALRSNDHEAAKAFFDVFLKEPCL